MSTRFSGCHAETGLLIAICNAYPPPSRLGVSYFLRKTHVLSTPWPIQRHMIKHKLMLVAIVAASIFIPAAVVEAQGLSISIGDRPHYTHGPRYWAGDYEMIWVAGHRSHGRWIHGHYIRGENRRRHHSNRRHDVRRYEDRRDDVRSEVRIDSVRR